MSKPGACAAGTAAVAGLFRYFRRPEPPPPPPPKPGRPPGSLNARRGPRSAQPAPTPAQPAPTPVQVSQEDCPAKKIPTPPAAQTPEVKLNSPACTRVNYSTGEALCRMQTAVDDWLEKKGVYLEEPQMSLKIFAAKVGIPYKTLKPYVCQDVSKRKQVGSGVGGSGKSLVNEDTSQFMSDVLRRRDRANDGCTRPEAVTMLQELQPELTRAQACRQFDRHVRPNHKDVLTNIVKAESTTSKRCAITVPQQWRWHQAVNEGFDFLRRTNTGTTPNGQTFGEVMPHFIVGGDEACLLASNGEVKVIGDKEKSKHQVQTSNSRTSITIYRSGNAAGSEGPTALLPAGIRRKGAYTDEFLVKHGAAPGSTIAMTKTGFMTELAWDELAPTIADGIRQMPVIHDNPDWWVLKIIDGFGPHTSSLKANDPVCRGWMRALDMQA